MRVLGSMVLSLALCGVSVGQVVNYEFQATIQSPFFVFGIGDYVTGTFGYDISDTTGAGEILPNSLEVITRQETPIASLDITFTDISTGNTARGGLDPSANSMSDLRATGNSGTSFKFFNILTEPNNLFNSSTGTSFESVSLLFRDNSPVLPADISGYEPHQVTLTLGIGSSTAGPNLVYDYIRPIPEPNSLTLFNLAFLALVAQRR